MFFRICVTALYLLAAPAYAASTETWSLLANGEAVGKLVAVTNGRQVAVDYQVSNNGRGPKIKETLDLDAAGMPRAWHIDGTSLMGGGVHEEMVVANGQQRWVSQADHGTVAVTAPKLYIGNDASPWILGQYVRALLAAPKNTLGVLPSGQLQLQKLPQVRVGSGARAVQLDAFFLSGITLTPQLLLMDRQQRLFAQVGDTLLVRAGYEDQAEALQKIGETLTVQRLAALQTALAHKYTAPLRIRRVHIFDPHTQQAGGLVSVVVYDGRIATIEAEPSAAPVPGQVEIDGQGGTLVAGLHDMHAHNNYWGGLFYLAAGVTTTRDMGNDNARLLAMNAQWDAGILPGPRIVRAGFIEGRSAQSARDGFIANTLDEGLRAVRWYADRDYIQIKIYNSMNPEWVKPLVTEAHRLGLRAVGHVPAFTTPDRVLEEGYDEVTHINQLMLGWLLKPGEDTRSPLRLTALARAVDLDLGSAPVKHTIALMQKNHAGLDTTISIVEQLMLSRAGQIPEGQAAWLEHMPIGIQRYRKRSFVSFKDDAESVRYQQAFAKVMDTLRLLHKEGIPLWPGTDDSTGFAVHRELELYGQLGMTPAEVLRIATLDCDRYMRRDQEYGSIERGKRADFFLVPTDPTKSLDALHTIRMVLKDGAVYYPSEIYTALGIKPFADAPPVTTIQ
jgi:imidazolonepropionase-like amidohydrolase